jgi:hypothetical protein
LALLSDFFTFLGLKHSFPCIRIGRLESKDNFVPILILELSLGHALFRAGVKRFSTSKCVVYRNLKKKQNCTRDKVPYQSAPSCRCDCASFLLQTTTTTTTTSTAATVASKKWNEAKTIQ